MADDTGVLAAARTIRPVLADLVGPGTAADLDRRIGELLDSPDDTTVTADRLRTLLGEHPDTTWFLRRVLDDAPHYRPPYTTQPRAGRHTLPDVDDEERAGAYRPAPRDGMAGLEGDLGWVDAELYRCPHQGCPETWERYDAQETPPTCPNPGHHALMVKA